MHDVRKAIQHNDLDFIDRWLSKTNDIKSAFKWVVINGRVEIVRRMIHFDSFDLADSFQDACRKAHRQIVGLILQRDPNVVNCKDGIGIILAVE